MLKIKRKNGMTGRFIMPRYLGLQLQFRPLSVVSLPINYIAMRDSPCR